MTLEELQAKVQELSDSNVALATKNKELLGEVKVAKAKAKGADIDPVEHAALQTEVEELRGTVANGAKASKTEIEKLTKQLGEKDGALQSHLIDGGLTEALLKHGVPAVMMPAVKALLRSKAGIKADGGQYQAVMGDKPLNEAVASWAASDEGKHFIAAPASSGGNSQGGGGKPGAAGGKRSQMDLTQRAAFIKEHGPEKYHSLPP